MGSMYHGLNEEHANYEASAVGAVLKMQVKDDALSEGDGNKSQKSDGDRSRRSHRDKSASHMSHQSAKSKRKPSPRAARPRSIEHRKSPTSESRVQQPIPRRKKLRALPSTAEQARAQPSRVQLANAETQIEMQIRVQAKQAAVLQRPCPIKNQPN